MNGDTPTPNNFELSDGRKNLLFCFQYLIDSSSHLRKNEIVWYEFCEMGFNFRHIDDRLKKGEKKFRKFFNLIFASWLTQKD